MGSSSLKLELKKKMETDWNYGHIQDHSFGRCRRDLKCSFRDRFRLFELG